MPDGPQFTRAELLNLVDDVLSDLARGREPKTSAALAAKLLDAFRGLRAEARSAAERAGRLQQELARARAGGGVL